MSRVWRRRSINGPAQNKSTSAKTLRTAARVIARHILPNVLSSLVVIATLELARAIVLEATLSFLGLGVQPPTPSWGGMVHEGREYLDSAWWISTAPGIVLMLTSIIVSRTGDWLRDLLDPTLRGE
jgi:peptide/nickel transport system permease protein